MEYSRKVAMTTLALVFAMAAAVQQVTAQDSPSDYLIPHNAARAAVGVGPVKWDATVAAYAQSYAKKRQGDCKLIHTPPGEPYGENLYGGRVGAGGDHFTAADAVKSWVNEKQYYNYTSNSCSSPLGPLMCGHYTQVVWRSSTAIGCARVVCNGNDGVFIICSYNPPGNWPGRRPYMSTILPQ